MSVAEYMEYALERGRWWAAKHPHLWDDILATAMLALVKAFDHCQPKYPKGYVSGCVDRGVIDLLYAQALIQIPKSEIARRKALKLGFEDLPRAFLAEDTMDGDSTFYPEYELWDIGKRSPQIPAWLIAHMNDVLKLLELSDYEYEIVRLRMLGHTLDGISGLLGKSKATLSEHLTNLQGRYMRISANPKRRIRRPREEA